FGEGISLIEGGGFLDLRDEVGGHWFAGLVVFRVMLHDLWVRCPVLIELRGELDEVARSLGAAEARILRVGKDSVKSVAEFVEHGGYVVEGEKRGFTGGGLLE